MKKDHFIWAFIIVCTMFNVIVVASYFAGLGKFNPAVTGPFGDTIGGVLSPIVGAVSIFYIIRAYTTQIESKQLEIDNSNYFLFNNTLSEISDKIGKLKYDLDFKNYPEGINHFKDKVYKETAEIHTIASFYISGNQHILVEDTLKIINDLSLIHEMMKGNSLTPAQRQVLEWKFNDFKTILSPINTALSEKPFDQMSFDKIMNGIKDFQNLTFDDKPIEEIINEFKDYKIKEENLRHAISNFFLN